MFKLKNKSLLRIVALLILSISALLAQQNKTDSLKLKLKLAEHDTTRCRILGAMVESENDATVWPAYNSQMQLIAENNLKSIDPKSPLHKTYQKYLATALNNTGYLFYQKGQVKEALTHFEKSLKLYEDIQDRGSAAELLNNIGVIYYQQSHISKALDYYLRSLKTQEEIGNKLRIATACNNIGSIYQYKGDIPKALEYFKRGLKLAEEVRDNATIGPALNNIALIYQKQGYSEKALEYNNRSLQAYEKTGDKNGMALAYNNIGLIYNRKGEKNKALEWYSKSLKIQEETGNKDGQALSFNNIGRVYHETGDLTRALEFYKKSLEIQEAIADKKGITSSLNNIATVHWQKKDYALATQMSSQSLEISQQIGFPEGIENAAELLTRLSLDKKDYKNAFENYKLYIKMRDSIANVETRKASVQNQLQYEYEKKAAADSAKNAEMQKVKDAQLIAQRAQIKQEQFQRYGLFSGLIIVLVGLGFVINRFRVTQKQKKIIESQKVMVDHAYEKLSERNKEVLDSIHYAKRIQTALVTNENYIHKAISRLKG